VKQLFRAPSPRQALFIGTALAAFFLFGCKSADNYAHVRKMLRNDPAKVQRDVNHQSRGAVFSQGKLEKTEYLWSRFAWMHPKEAVAEMTQVIDHSPQYGLAALAYTCRAKAYMQLEQYDKAAVDFEKALSLGSKYAETYREYVYLVFLTKPIDYAKIADIYARWIGAMPVRDYIYDERGKAYLECGEYALAVKDFTRFIGEASDRPGAVADALKSRAQAYHGLGEYSQAIDDYNALVKFDRWWYNYYLRGKTYYAMGRHEEAIADYNKKWSSTIEYYDGTYDSTGRRPYAIAAEHYTKILDAHPDSANIRYRRGQAYFKAEEYAKAAADFTALLAAGWDAREICRLRAQAFEKSNNHAGAVGDYSRLIELEPDSVKWHVKRAGANSALGNYELALEDYREALGRNPGNGYYLIEMSFIRRRMGDYEGAIADLSEVIRLGRRGEPGEFEEYEKRMTPCVWAHMYRAGIHKMNCDTTAALADYMEMVDIAMNSPYWDWFSVVADAGFPGALEILIDRKEYTRALALLDDYERNQPIKTHSNNDPSAWALYEKGLVYFKMGDLERANGYYKEAVKYWSRYADKPYK